MKLLNDTTKLIITAVLLFGLLIYSYQHTSQNKRYQPQTISFQTPTGPKTLLDYKGKLILMYFGFLACPEACPTTMSHVGGAFKQLSPDELNKVVMIFVDLDPERDDIIKLKNYTEYFHPQIIPFRTDLKTLDLFTQFYGIAFKKVLLKSAMGYTIDHSTEMLVLSPKGEVLTMIHHEANTQLVYITIKNLIKENFNKDLK